ncbi:MAG: carboxypeptidase-like regulatory domain-containing protein [Bacteroidia bacterium]|nr:carboxypeptidase-like regulatory domain-containing protein [Bacteroidia bacterium]
MRPIHHLFLFLLFLLCFPLILMAQQTGSVRGFLYDKDSGEPILFTPVYLKGTQYGTTTDVNGFYSITQVPPGSYVLTVSTVGYDTVLVNIEIAPNQVFSKQLYVKKAVVNLKTVEVSAEREARKTEVRTSVNKITPREIKNVPSIGGEPDLAQYLQVLPGVVFSGDQGGQLYIRGGTPVMNKVLLDGMIVYNPFHSIGLFSVFDTDILRNADVYTGGFPADYGDRISSVMDITTRDGNKRRYSGKFSATTFSGKLLFEGPIKKQKEDGGGSSTFLLSYKNSYLDQSSKVLYDYIDEDGLPFSFQDIYGKISLNGENGSKLNLFGFDFSDNAVFKDVTDINWKSNGFGSNFILVPKGSNTLIDGVFAFSQYKVKQSEANEPPRSSLINGFNFGFNLTSFINKDELKIGFEVLGFRTELYTNTITGLTYEQIENTTEFGSFIRYRISREKIVVEPSIRFQYFASLSEFSPEPRIGIKYNAFDKVRFKLAGGLYAQNLISSVSDRDVVNLFYGFLSGPESLPEEFNGKEVTSRLQRARDLIFGVEIDAARHLSVNIEAFYKKFTQLSNINRDKVYPDNGFYQDKPDYLTKDFIIEEGKAYGADLVVKYEYKRAYLWAVYSLTYVDRYDGIREYRPHFDRRHNVNLVGSYTFGKKLDWEFNVRWNFGSGFPFSGTAGFYEYQNFSGGLYTDPLSNNGDLGIVYGPLNQKRLPPYHRLDFSLRKTFVTGKNSNLDLTASAINVYDRENIFYFDRVRYQRVNQLPFIPSLGLSMTF